jgi:hypothetical protein
LRQPQWRPLRSDAKPETTSLSAFNTQCPGAAFPCFQDVGFDNRAVGPETDVGVPLLRHLTHDGLVRPQDDQDVVVDVGRPDRMICQRFMTALTTTAASS